MITDMVSNEKLNSLLTELFIRERKVNIYVKLNIFIAQSYFTVPKNIRLHSTHILL